MAEETITFELVRKIQREEQRLPKPTKLPENFYKNVNNYIQQKRKTAESMGDRKIGFEVKNIGGLIEDVFNRRERKILNGALIAVRTNIAPENLTEEEKMFFDLLVRSIKERRNAVLNHVFDEAKEPETVMEAQVVFKEDIAEFVGSDLRKYGPYKKGDVVILPEDNVKILLEKGIVEGLE
jgi:DNA replication factor GINS